MADHGTAPNKSGRYIEFQAAVLRQLPRLTGDDLEYYDEFTALKYEYWIDNQERLKEALLKILTVFPVQPKFTFTDTNHRVEPHEGWRLIKDTPVIKGETIPEDLTFISLLKKGETRITVAELVRRAQEMGYAWGQRHAEALQWYPKLIQDALPDEADNEADEWWDTEDDKQFTIFLPGTLWQVGDRVVIPSLWEANVDEWYATFSGARGDDPIDQQYSNGRLLVPRSK